MIVFWKLSQPSSLLILIRRNVILCNCWKNAYVTTGNKAGKGVVGDGNNVVVKGEAEEMCYFVQTLNDASNFYGLSRRNREWLWFVWPTHTRLFWRYTHSQRIWRKVQASLRRGSTVFFIQRCWFQKQRLYHWNSLRGTVFRHQGDQAASPMEGSDILCFSSCYYNRHIRDVVHTRRT